MQECRKFQMKRGGSTWARQATTLSSLVQPRLSSASSSAWLVPSSMARRYSPVSSWHCSSRSPRCLPSFYSMSHSMAPKVSPLRFLSGVSSPTFMVRFERIRSSPTRQPIRSSWNRRLIFYCGIVCILSSKDSVLMGSFLPFSFEKSKHVL